MKRSADPLARHLLEPIGESSLAFFSYLGGAVFLLWRIIRAAWTLPWGRWLIAMISPWRWRSLTTDRSWNALLDQMEKVGISSFPLVSLTALFTGMVLALQSAYQLQSMSAERYVGALVALSMTRELGPVLTALVIAGRVGAAITAEVGTMQVTEQIDALHTLATDPVKHLAVPRFAALLLMLPVLTLYADLIGILGGYMVGVYKLGISSGLYMKMTWDPLRYKDLFTGLLKAGVFSMIISTVACYEGFATSGGAEGVGRSTTLSVVISFILIITADCFFTALFYFMFP